MRNEHQEHYEGFSNGYADGYDGTILSRWVSVKHPLWQEGYMEGVNDGTTDRQEIDNNHPKKNYSFRNLP